MPQAVLILTVACIAGLVPGDPEKVVAAIRTAFEDNRAALSATGTIRFHSCDGHLGPASSVEGIDASLKAAWKRRSPSQGMYVFDGANRRYDNLHSPEVLVGRRTMLSPTSWSATISSDRLLSDGETTLMDNIAVASDGQTVLHSPGLRAGVKEFFRLAEGIPLRLGDPDPPRYDLGKCLAKVLEGREKVVLMEVDEAARLDGVAVVKLRVDDQDRQDRITFWVDLEHGAIPVQTRILEFIPQNGGTVVIQINNNDIKWAGRGWLPFRWSGASGELSSTGELPSLFVREVEIEEAEFTKRPDRAVFSLEFPKEYTVSDSDRWLNFGSRRVWDLKDFSPAARARARPIGGGGSSVLPEMPRARLPWAWWPLSLIVLGITLLLAAGTIVFRRVRRHA